MTASIETPLALFRNPVKILRFDPAVLAHRTLVLVRKFSMPLLGILPHGKALWVIGSPMMEIGYIERIEGTERLGINDAVRLDLLLKDRPQRLGSGVGDDGGVTLPAALSKPEDDNFACCAAASLALAHTPEVTLIRLHFATELIARELADEQRAQVHEEEGRGVGLNADDLSGSTRRATRHKMLDQLALLTGTEAAFALIHRSQHRAL